MTKNGIIWEDREVLWKGQPAVQLRGWQTAPNGDPKKATTVIRVNGRKRIAFAEDIRSIKKAV